jgi:NAD(P)-dependent dehydrogenase (short-subunit alcohol dehydrogenase family)
MELAPHAIRSNGVAPTFVTPSRSATSWRTRNSAVTSRERIPLGRIADPKDIVGPVLFFCSPGASFVTGQVMYVDGGITASQ